MYYNGIYYPFCRYFSVPPLDPRQPYYPYEESNFKNKNHLECPHKHEYDKSISPSYTPCLYNNEFNRIQNPQYDLIFSKQKDKNVLWQSHNLTGDINQEEKGKSYTDHFQWYQSNNNNIGKYQKDSSQPNNFQYDINDFIQPPKKYKSLSKTMNSIDFPETDHYTKKSYQPKHPLSKADLKRKKIAEENYEYVKRNPDLIDHRIDTIDEPQHADIDAQLKPPIRKETPIYITGNSTIDSAIYYHDSGYSRICILNFADARNPGGGYLNGRNAQEESLCRQTFLYPTLKESKMYDTYRNERNLYSKDIMIYSPNVRVIRDNDNLPLNFPFNVNVISAPAVDNRKYVRNSKEIMKRRIRKIIKLAAFKKNKILILGAFGCGVFNNDPSDISKIFAEVLIDEGLKNYFTLVIFPIYQNEYAKDIFKKALSQKP